MIPFTTNRVEILCDLFLITIAVSHFYQIPLTKSKILAPNEETKNKAPRISCDLCKYTYNLKSGEQLEAAEATGLFGGIAKSILGSQEGGDLSTYELGEKNGRIMFTMKGM